MLTEELLCIRDVSMRGEVLFEYVLPMPARAVVLRELIEQRVRRQVQDHLAGKPAATTSAFEVDEVERILNGREAGSARIDADRHVARALAGFEANAYVVIVDGAQVCSLDARVPVSADTDVRFMRLTPLAGG